MNAPQIGDLHYFSGMPADFGQVVGLVKNTEGRILALVQNPLGIIQQIEGGAIQKLESLITSQAGIFSQFANMIPSIMRSL